MTSSRSCLTAAAILFLSLSWPGRTPAQSSPVSPLVSEAFLVAPDGTADLPDSPSFSTSLQQAPTPPPPGETEEQRKLREQREEAEREVKAQEKQRIGGVIPDFSVVMNGHAVPLTPRQKWSLSLHTIIDPYTIGIAAVFGGGYGELTDDHTGYGHGPSGYFKRVAASYADNVIGNVVGNAMLPTILHQDPRYFRKGEGSIKSRIIYSALTTFICHGDNGKRQFNVSNVMGNFIAGGISNAYYPADERGIGLTLTNASVVTLEGMVGAQLLEFSPDITEKLQRHRQAKRDAKAAAAAARQLPPTATPTPPQPTPPQP